MSRIMNLMIASVIAIITHEVQGQKKGLTIFAIVTYIYNWVTCIPFFGIKEFLAKYNFYFISQLQKMSIFKITCGERLCIYLTQHLKCTIRYTSFYETWNQLCSYLGNFPSSNVNNVVIATFFSRFAIHAFNTTTC